jgi:hypothetical protein
VQNPSITNVQLAAAGTYSLTITVNGCLGTTSTTTVSVTPLPATPQVLSNSPVCDGSSIILSTTSVVNATYSWSGPNGFTSALQNPSITSATAAMAGIYTLTYDAGGCISTATTNVVVNTPVLPTFNQIAPICEDAAAPAFVNNSTNAPTIAGTWNPAAINTANSGTFTYTFTPNAGICATQATMNIQILPNEQATFNQLPDLCINDVPPLQQRLPAAS